MLKLSNIIFQFNFFKNKNDIRGILRYNCTDYLLTIGTIVFGCFIAKSSFSYIERDIIGFIFGFPASLVFIIYNPIIYYVNRSFYSRLIIYVKENKRNEILVFLHNQKRVRIKRYQIINDWRPYFSTFYLFIYKLEYYKNHWLLQEKNTRYFTIKDLDTGQMYLFCVNKEQYTNYLENH